MKTILGIDQSYTSSGYCVINEAGDLLHFGKIKSNKEQTTYQRALNTALTICELIDLHKPSEVNLEGLAFGIRGDATRDLAGLLFTIINVVALKHPAITVTTYAPTSVKKSATGTGKAKKNDMIAALPEVIRNEILAAGFKKTTGLGDLADAYFIAKMSLKQTAQ